MKFMSRGNRSPQTPSPPITPVTPSPPITLSSVSRSSFPKTLYLYKSASETVKTWAKLNPAFKIQVYNNTETEQFLLEEFGVLHRDIFRLIPDEDIQSKFMGICILFAYGGFYSDIGNVPLVSLEQFIESDVDFVTCNSYLNTLNSYWGDMKFNFNPSFIASQKESPILKNCLDWYVQRYKANTPYSYLGWNMTRAFTEVLILENYSPSDGVYDANTMKIQILKECFDTKSHNVYCEYGKKSVIDNNSFA